MNEFTIALLVIGALVLFALSAFFSGSETALMAVNRLRMRALADDGDPRARRVLTLLDDTGRLLSGILLGNNFVNILLASLATAIAADAIGGYAPLVVSPLLTVLLLIFAEILPKTLAAERSVTLSRRCAAPLSFFLKVAGPAISLVNSVSNFFLRPWKKEEDGSSSVTIDDLVTFAKVGHEEGAIETVTHDILHGLHEFSSASVRLVMVPRYEIVSMPLSAGIEGFGDLVRSSGHTRIPVWSENEEDIIGILHAKDLLHRGEGVEEYADLRTIVRPPTFIPESTTLATALKHMQDSASEMVFVVDEYGGLEGLVTLKDLLEELVGEIEDEHQKTSGRRVDLIRSGTFVADARSSLRYIRRKTGIDLTREGVSTLGGLLVNLSPDDLAPGTKIAEGEVTFTVLTMNGRFLKKVRVDAPVLLEDEEQAPEV